MEVLIVEDEKPAAQHLVRLISDYDPEIDIKGPLDSIKSTVKYLHQNEPPDLIFLDIQLGDGLSFEIFEMMDITTPIVFTTAYDEYALRAFKVNSIDYILKPIDADELLAALKKYHTINQKTRTAYHPDRINDLLAMMKNPYKSRFIVKTGEKIKSVPVEDIVYFFSREKAIFFKASDGINYLSESTLDHLIEVLDPARFFRVNRQYIISHSAIENISTYFNNRLIINLKYLDEGVIVSRERVKDFKLWLDS